jgi:hypothetical protein
MLTKASEPRAQDVLPQTMMRMLEQIEVETGMVGTILLGGPEPKTGGGVIVMT